MTRTHQPPMLARDFTNLPTGLIIVQGWDGDSARVFWVVSAPVARSMAKINTTVTYGFVEDRIIRFVNDSTERVVNPATIASFVRICR